MSVGLGLIPFRKELNRLRVIYKKISDRIVREMLSVDLINFGIRDAIRLRRFAEKELKKADVVAVRWSGRNVPRAYKRGEEFAKGWLEKFRLEEDPQKKDIHVDAVEEEKKILQDYLIEANIRVMQSVERWIYLSGEISKSLLKVEEFGGGLFSPEEEELILQQIAEGAMEGVGRGKLKNQIRARLANKVKDGNLIEIKGKMWRMDKYADLVARTELRRTQSEAVKNESIRMGHDLVEVSDHGDTDEECDQYAGNIYSISGEDPKYPFLDQEPPFHPNCMHFLIPYVEF
jgi:hypothetical protein